MRYPPRDVMYLLADAYELPANLDASENLQPTTFTGESEGKCGSSTPTSIDPGALGRRGLLELLLSGNRVINRSGELSPRRPFDCTVNGARCTRALHERCRLQEVRSYRGPQPLNVLVERSREILKHT